MHAWLLAALVLSTPEAETTTLSEEYEPPEAPRNWVNMRVGASSAGAPGHPDLCLEVAPLSFLSVEACGTGSGILHHDPSPEMARFHAKLVLHTFQFEGFVLQPQVGLGIAELQVGEDAAGFSFGGTGPRGNETAGPEASGHLRLLFPIDYGFELVGDVSFGAAYLPHAPELVVPNAALQLNVGFSAGIGF